VLSTVFAYHTVVARIPSSILWLCYGLDDWGNTALMLSGQGIFLFHSCSDLLWGPTSPLFNGYWHKTAMAWICSWPTSSARVENSGAVWPFLCVNGVHNGIFTFTVCHIQWVAICLSNCGSCHSCIFIGTLLNRCIFMFFICLRGNRSESNVVDTQFDSHQVFHPDVKLDWFVVRCWVC
jgi:hypothetical protein